jgi:hypothetical protein
VRHSAVEGKVNDMPAASNLRKKKAADAEAPATSLPARVAGYAVFEIKRREDPGPLKTNVSGIKPSRKQFWKTVRNFHQPRPFVLEAISTTLAIGPRSFKSHGTNALRLYQSKRSIERRHRTIYDSENRVPAG